MTLVASGNDDELLLVLLEGESNPNAMDRNVDSIMFGAVAEERIEQIKMLMCFRVNINLMNRFGENSALHAAYINRYEMVHFLIKQGADYAVRNDGSADIACQARKGYAHREIQIAKRK